MTTNHSKPDMDEQEPFDERRFAVSKSAHSFMQRPCSLLMIRRRDVAEKMFIHTLHHKKSDAIPDRPHGANNPSMFRKQRSRSGMNSLAGEFPVARRRLTGGEEGEPATGT